MSLKVDVELRTAFLYDFKILMPLIITIDGPSASGKSTVSRKAALRLKFIHVDSGSLYRGLTWHFLREGVEPDGKNAVGAALNKIQMNFFVKDNALEFSIDGIEPNAELRTQAINENVSQIAAVPELRDWVVQQLRKMSGLGNLVMEGRDIGTAVFPEAHFKFYLDATPEERARRRCRELWSAGRRIEYEEVLRSILRRDDIDSSRAFDPLKVAPNAVVIQTTKMSIEEVVNFIIDKIQSSDTGIPKR